MSNAVAYRQYSREFLSAHPWSAGWKVYEYAGGDGHRLYLYYLIDFLHEKYPESVTMRKVYGIVDGSMLLGEESQSERSSANGRTKTARELRCDPWLGRVDVVWENEDIHFLAFPITGQDGFRHFHFLATKSIVALQQLLHELDSYGRARQREESHAIFVVNGKDIPITPVCWDEVILPSGFAEDIRANATAFLQGQERYAQLGIPYRRGFLFCGPPGCGKTLTLKALAHTMPAKFVTVLGRANVSDEEIQHAFYVAEKHAPAVVLFEDIDKLIHTAGISLSHFLNMLDGLQVTKGVLVIATSNEPQLMDPALLHRPSRFDRMWVFPLPSMEQRLALLHKRGQGYFSDTALQDVAHRSQGFSMAYVQEIVVNALLGAAHNGTTPSDADIFRSLDTLRVQRKCASKGVESLEEHDTVGFSVTN